MNTLKIIINKKLLILIFSVFIFSIFAEILMRNFNPQITYSKSVENSINCYSKHPLITFSLAKNHTCRMININGEYKSSATINKLGYRGREFITEKQQGVKRILIIGDSMTFGWGVADNETYPILTEQLLKAGGKQSIEVINAGYKGGLSLDSFYIFLKNEGLKLKPDLVIVGFTIFNDIEDLATNNWIKIDGRRLPEKIESCCHTVDGNILRNKIISFKYRYPILRELHLYLAITDFIQKRLGIFPDKPLLSTKGEEYLGCTLNPDCRDKFKEEENKAIRIIAEMRRLTKEGGGKFMVVMFPVDYQIYPEAVNKYSRYGMKWPLKEGEADYSQKRLGELFKQNRTEYLDLYQYFTEKKDRGYPFFPIDAHFNPLGHRLVAEALANYLNDKLPN